MYITTIASGSSGNCYKISDGTTTLLLEAGIPASKIQVALKFRLSDVAGVLVSHSHGDHCKACKDLISKGIDIYTSTGTAKEIGIDTSHRTHMLPPLQKASIGTFEILPFPVEHDTAEPFGYKIKSTMTGEAVLFATDTYYIKYNFEGITHLMIECNYIGQEVRDNVESGKIDITRAKRVYKSHMSLETAIRTIELLPDDKLQEIYLMHLSGDNSDEEVMRDAIAKVTKAKIIIC